MRGLLLAAALLGLGACAAVETPPGPAEPGWRTSAGLPLSRSEVQALRSACAGQARVTPIDTDQPVPNPLRDDPAYRPGGEGLANAPQTGVAAAGRPIEPATRRIASAGVLGDQCLYDQGLVRIR